MINNIHNKQRFSIGAATLTLGILSVIFPLFYSIVTVQIFSTLIGKNVISDFVIYAGYAFFATYFVIIILGVVLGIIDLFKKPRLWHRENTKTLLGLAFIVFSIVVIGRIFVFSELFQAILQSIQ